MRSLALILTVGAAALGGCATTPDEPPPVNSLARYTLQVEPGLDRIALAVHDNGLSSTQRAALGDLVLRYFQAQAGWLRVEAPAGDDPAATSHAYAVRDALQTLGVPGDRILLVGYAAPDPRAPVLASFETLRPVIPNCAGEPRAMEGSFTNRSAPGFGCAVTANMAAQIANPRDILGQRAMPPAETGRSAVVFAKYRAGDTTSAEQEPLIEGRVAQAVD